MQIHQFVNSAQANVELQKDAINLFAILRVDIKQDMLRSGACYFNNEPDGFMQSILLHLKPFFCAVSNGVYLTKISAFSWADAADSAGENCIPLGPLVAVMF